MINSKKIKFRTAVFVSLFFCFLMAVYAPLSIYINNVEEFTYDIYDIMKWMLPVFAVSLCLSLLFYFILFRISKKVFYIFSLVLFAVTVILYISGTFLAGNLPPLDGRPFVWSDYSSQRIYYVILIAAVVFGIFFLSKKKGHEKTSDAVSYVSIFGTIFLLIALGLSLFTGDALRRKAGYMTTYDDVFDLSKDQNMIILILDAVDGKTYNELSENHPEYADYFEDFTCYDNALGAYPFTTRAIPFILTGQWYENQESLYSYSDYAFSASPLLQELENRNYRIGIYDMDLLTSEENMLRFENTIKADKADFIYPLAFYKIQFKLVGYRYFPFDLKKYCETSPAGIFNATQTYLTGEQDSEYFSSSNHDFEVKVASQEIDFSSEKCFRYIHLHGAHHPLVYDTYEEQVSVLMPMVDEFLTKLKDNGVYDNTSIIIMSDHGFNDDDNPIERAHAMLLVKGVNEHHEYRTSSAPVSFADLQTAYARLLDNMPADQLFDFQEGDYRERRYLSYSLFDPTITEYIQYGHADDLTTLIPTGKVFSVK